MQSDTILYCDFHTITIYKGYFYSKWNMPINLIYTVSLTIISIFLLLLTRLAHGTQMLSLQKDIMNMKIIMFSFPDLSLFWQYSCVMTLQLVGMRSPGDDRMVSPEVMTTKQTAHTGGHPHVSTRLWVYMLSYKLPWRFTPFDGL